MTTRTGKLGGRAYESMVGDGSHSSHYSTDPLLSFKNTCGITPCQLDNTQKLTECHKIGLAAASSVEEHGIARFDLREICTLTLNIQMFWMVSDY